MSDDIAALLGAIRPPGLRGGMVPSPDVDAARLRAGLDVRDLLAQCLDGVEDPVQVEAWREYVRRVALVGAALMLAWAAEN